jgi:DNA polymerase-3 subunit gamma/tau
VDQRDQIKEIIKNVPLNTLSRIWQVMVAAVPEMQAAGNQKQCFDMLVVRLMHIADMPSISELMKQADAPRPNVAAVKQALNERNANNAQPDAQPNTVVITNANDLANALHASKEILLYSYYSSNIEVAEITDGKIKYFDRKGDADFASKLSTWLLNKTGRQWQLERQMETVHAHTITEQKKEELEADPMIADAMSLFEGAEIVGVK